MDFKKDSYPRWALAGHAFNCMAALVVLFSPIGAAELYTVRVIYCVSLGFALGLLWYRRNNALFFARTLLLLMPGYFAAGVQLFDPSLYYSYYERVSQTLDVSLTMFALSNLALLGSEIGLHRGTFRVRAMNSENPLQDDIYFYISVIPVIAISYYVALMYGSSLFEASYSNGGGISGMGSAGTFGTVLLFAMFGHLTTRATLHKYWIFGFCVFFLLGYAILLRGGRQDVLSGFFGLYVLYWGFRGRPARISGITMIAALAVAVLMEFFGFLRANVLTANFNYADCFHQFIEFYLHPGDTVSFDVFSGIATTFANTIYAKTVGLAATLNGRTYWEYILRTPPEFLYPGRPQDYALIFKDWNLSSGGGFFELAEAYINFGVLGAIVVPFAISFFISRVFYSFLNGRSLLSCFALFGIMSVFLRGALYQTFAFYRAQLVAMTILLTLYFLVKIASGRGRDVRDIRVS